MRRTSSIAMVALFAIFIGSPLTMLAFGAKAPAIENRAKKRLVAPSRATLADASWFDLLSGAILDNLPLRPTAVRADAWIDLNVFGDSPSSRVILGRDGWLYTVADLEAHCVDRAGADLFAREIETAARIFEAVGKRLLVVVPPDKTTVYPDNVPDSVELGCVLGTAERLGAITSPHLLTAWDELRAARADRQVYFRLNTHWTRAGAAVMAAMVVDALEPGLWDPDAVVRLKRGMMEGDLTRIIGLPRSEPYDVFDVRRAGVKVAGSRAQVVDLTGEPIPGLKANRGRARGGPAVPGRTLVLHDSFGWALSHFVGPYLADGTFINLPQPERAPLWPYVREADTVVVVSVQRGAYERVVGTRLSEKIATIFADDLPEAGARIRRSAAGYVVPPPPEGATWFAVVTRATGSAASVVVGGRRIVVDATTPARAIRVPPGGLAIDSDPAAVRVRVVAVPGA